MPSRTPLTTSQAARVLKMSSESIRRFGAKGILKSYDTPLGRLYDAEAVEQMAADREAVSGGFNGSGAPREQA